MRAEYVPLPPLADPAAAQSLRADATRPHDSDPPSKPLYNLLRPPPTDRHHAPQTPMQKYSKALPITSSYLIKRNIAQPDLIFMGYSEQFRKEMGSLNVPELFL